MAAEKKLSCEVASLRQKLWDALVNGKFDQPRSRYFAEEMLNLVDDISWGRAGEGHVDAVKNLAEKIISEGESESSVKTARDILNDLIAGEEVFHSHVATRNCPSGDCVVLAPSPCQMACPAGLDIPSYVTLIAMGKDDEAVEIIREDNPFPWVCGLVCTHPCEFVCVRGRIDEPIAIRNLKAFASERVMSRGGYRNPVKAPDKGKKVCIIGAGPAGLTAAYFLALKGYGVTVIDALPVAGGMMMVGIPRFRLPREVIDREVDAILALGVELRLNTRLGRDVTIEQLNQEGYEAILIAIGAHGSFRMNVPGEDDYPQVVSAVDFLRRVALGERLKPGRRVAIIGGGNVAIDAARTCIRLGCEKVTIVYRRSRVEMPASEEEVLQAEEEGVDFVFLTVPVEVVGSNGKVTGLKCVRTQLGPPDDQGRRRPVPVPGSEHIIEVDAVITAIGQKVEKEGLIELKGLDWTRRETIRVNTVTMETSIEGVFAAGDVVTGPATVIEAIGAGKKAADAIDRYLQGLPQPKRPPVPVRRRRLECLKTTASQKMRLHRPQMPLLNCDRRRITFQQVELGYDEDDARAEGYRCLRCDICRRCGRCVEVCRDLMKVDALPLGHFDFDHPVATDFRQVREKCILCGACAANCPNEAMVMEEKDGERILYLCGTELNRLKLEYCTECGKPLGPERYHDFVMQRLRAEVPVTGDMRICIDCARKRFARSHDDSQIPPA
ncbi:NAD(P)-binding protein [Thermodesulforhabdus norvegica]|uniref:Putative selenate reductase, YgfK subunit n=1 Tax=Thermodesulforhabdus norvegica TaxID=39841 RepID=A0A1I4QJG5_9BACT|nr:NAD(P)-binding protein [Thermodesulforhabdus norvegica]SFM40201.1 putative selenate reductase, YgfK subunit [Thermodesulforhabdus norvegica]